MNRRQKLVQQQFLNNEKAVVDRLQYIYDQSLHEVQAKIRNLEFTIGDLTEVYDWMDDTDPKKAVIKSKIQSKIYQKQYQEQIQDQLDGILKKMQTQEFLTVSDYLDTCYEDGFVGSLFDLHGQGIPLTMPLNQEATVRAIQLESKISKGLYTRLGEDVGVLKKRITSEVTRSIATGTGWKQMAKRLENQTKIGYNKSVRIARTEGHRIQCTAADDAAHDAKDRGADIVKQWDATLDGATRESHVAVDGQIRELDDRFGNGLMFPGDPSGAAAEVINCRCAYLQRARWALDGKFTKWNNFTGQLETFDSPEAYDEFKKGFFSPENKKYMNYVRQLEDKYHTKDFQKLLGQMSDREYKHYSKLLANNPLYNKNAKAKTPSFQEQIQVIKDRVKNAGHATAADIHEAGKLIKGARGLDARNAEAQRVYDELLEKEKVMSDKIDDLQKQIDDLTNGAEFDPFEALMNPDSTGYSGLDPATDKKVRDLKKQIDGIKGSDEWKKMHNQLFEARKKLHLTGKESADNLKQVLSEFRSMGHVDVNKAVGKSSSKVRKHLVEAMDYYPTDWIELVIPEPLGVKKVDRGYFSKWDNLIALSGWDDDGMFETAIHELGHCFEHKVSINNTYTSYKKWGSGYWRNYYKTQYPTGQTFILDAEREFYAKRTAGEDLKWLGAGYKRTEQTRRDNFIHPYMGKDYEGNDFELVSMGFQYAYTDPDKLAKDPDMESWIYGILALY